MFTEALPAATVGAGAVIDTAFPVSVKTIAPAQPASPAAGAVIPVPPAPTLPALAVQFAPPPVPPLRVLFAFANVGPVTKVLCTHIAPAPPPADEMLLDP